MIRSRCLCGEVAWEIDGLDLMSHCHCSRCRKTHGTAFATYAAGPLDRFRLTGREHIVRWQSSPGLFRTFCGRCGSVVPGDPFDGRMFVPIGNCEDDPVARPLAHIFVASKAPWYDIQDSLPRFDAYPAGVNAPVVADRAAVDPPGNTRGTCLCGGVAYVLTEPPVRAYHCHCGRCRRARSAAHASNLFVPAAGLRFTRGEDLLASYKPPDAIRFAQVFCRVCGSKLPRPDRDRGVAGIPMGSLDDDPGIRPQAHIFVGSKAPWYEIGDDLPQFPEYPT